MPLDIMKALGARQEGMPDPDGLGEGTEVEDEGDVDPRGQSADGNTLFIDKERFPPKCKVGDTVIIKATVTKHGAKYGVVPEEITRASGAAGEMEEGGGEDY